MDLQKVQKKAELKEGKNFYPTSAVYTVIFVDVVLLCSFISSLIASVLLSGPCQLEMMLYQNFFLQ